MERVLVILCGGLDKNEKPNDATKLRYDKAIEIESKYDKIVISSDRTWRKEFNNHKTTEAKAGEKYLISKGISKNKIVLEEKSRDTFSNLFYTRKILDKMKVNKFDIITSKFHISKTKVLMSYVFPKKDYDFKFIKAKDPNNFDIKLKKLSEKELIKFYKDNLEKNYNVVKGDMKSIEKFIKKYNPAYTNKKDKYHRELTKKVNQIINTYREKINENTYDFISKGWEEKRKSYWKPVQDFLDEQENKNSFIDIGCGSGRFLELAKEKGFKKIVGTDISKNQLKICRQKGFKVKKADMIKLPFKEESFNVIISIAAHHHLLSLEEQKKSLEEMKRIIKPGGKILLSNWFPSKEYIDKNIDKGKINFIDDKIAKVTFEYENKKNDRYYYFFEERELCELITNTGLKILKKEYNNGNLYLTLGL